MSAPALGFSGVTFGYGRTPVLSGLDLTIDRGEIVGLLGPNGAGKTTCVRLASGAVAAVSGRVDLFGDDVATLGARERARRVAVVPQETHPVFEFTVSEIVRMGRAPHLGFLGLEGPKDRELAHGAMRRCAIDHLADRSFRALSGGEHQRVLLARALTQGTPLLLLDEPTAFLDIKHRLVAYDVLVRLRDDAGPAIVIVSHDVNLAARYCDRLVLMRAGAIVASGAPEDVLTRAAIGEAYDVNVQIGADPATGRPFVIPLSPR
ncbi:MAG TPA: ABC transporter ATP-binding protein [Candidatus Bathyarchaeia archaeon]|nr:ABC transporter ATP-binding protein [Candidatus Bathyarchaeia archaeon]